MITDMIKFTIKPDSIAEAAELMKGQMKANLGDEGCMLSKTFQSKSDPGDMYMLLCWENQSSIDKHLASAHDSEFRDGLDPLLAGPPEFFEWEELV